MSDKKTCECGDRGTRLQPDCGAGAVSRRDVLLKVGAGLTAVGAAATAVPVLGFVASSFKTAEAEREWVTLGPLEQFPVDETRLVVYQNPATRPWDGDTAHVPCWVRRIDQQTFQVFAVNCTHLGCPVRWFPGSRLFMCPCHGGAFYADGSHASGPPPRGLFEYPHRIEAGELKVLAGHLPTLAEPL